MDCIIFSGFGNAKCFLYTVDRLFVFWSSSKVRWERDDNHIIYELKPTDKNSRQVLSAVTVCETSGRQNLSCLNNWLVIPFQYSPGIQSFRPVYINEVSAVYRSLVKI